MKEIILDTETTGLDPKNGHRIVEIGAVKMHNKVLTGEKFHYYINPERDMPTEAYRIHGISGEFLKNKPLFQDIADEFLNFINDGGVLVIHNAVFDVQFINHELSLLNRSSINFINLANTIDTLAMARKQFPGMKSSLDALCKRFKIDNSGRQLHGALKDAMLLAEVYVELTGGRQANFKLDSNKAKDINITQNVGKDKKSTIVIKPTEDELIKHKNFLTKIPSNSWNY
jgi:DNA polymerase-3 subunit epsilon